MTTPTLPYSPYDKETQRLKNHIRRAFIKEILITKLDYANQYIIQDGKPYMLANTQRLDKNFAKGRACWCGKISFQEHTSGFYAVLPH